MAAAASSGKRVRRERELAALHRKLSDQRRTLRSRTGQKFDELSEDGVWLMEAQIDELLALAMRKSESKLQPDAVQLVIDTAHRSQEKAELEPPAPGAVTKKHICRAVEKYGEYINNAQKIDDVFKKYDKEKDGYLSKKELMKMLSDYERKQTRSKGGIVIKLIVSPEDIDWIIEEADSDNTGMINHAEYLPAIAAWEEVARMKLEESGTGCTIM